MEVDGSYKEQWELMKQMVNYYLADKNYLTKREIKHILRVCEAKDINKVLIKPLCRI